MITNAETESALLQQASLAQDKASISAVIAFQHREIFSLIPPSSHWLEIGCGFTPLPFGLASESLPVSYLATDVSQELINVARTREPRIDYLVTDNPSDALSGRKFDVILLKGVLHHIEYPGTYLKNLLPLLKPGGLLVLHEPETRAILARIAKAVLAAFGKSMEASPYGQLTPVQIKAALAEAGFKLEKEKNLSFSLTVLTGDYGRIPFFPSSLWVGQKLIAIENISANIFNRWPKLAPYFGWKTLYLCRR